MFRQNAYGAGDPTREFTGHTTASAALADSGFAAHAVNFNFTFTLATTVRGNCGLNHRGRRAKACLSRCSVEHRQQHQEQGQGQGQGQQTFHNQRTTYADSNLIIEPATLTSHFSGEKVSI